MPSLPLSTAFTDSAVTEGAFKTAITNQREYLADLLGTDGVKQTALATLGALFGSLIAKNSNYTVIASDNGKVIQATSTFTLSLTAAATLGSSFSFILNNVGAGNITIDPSGSEQIDGQTTKELNEGQSAIVYCDGTNFFTVGLSAAGGGFSNMQVFTSSGTFTVPAGITKVKVTVVGGGGAGAVSPAVSFSYRPGGGGGGGGAAIEVISGLTPASTVSVTVGGAGGTSSFGSFCSATGGGNAASYAGGTGGAGSGGNLNIGGGGGGGGDQASTDSGSGAGGNSILGGGGASVQLNSNGQNGRDYGGGGSGGGGGSFQRTAGAGAAGVVIVEY